MHLPSYPSPCYPADSLPETKVVTIGGFRIGLIHGHQVAPAGEVESLAAIQRSLDVDVVVSGHTHKTSISEYDGRCFVNPGSLTGAYTPLVPLVDEAAAAAGGLALPKTPNPSFLLMNISGEKIDFFVYELSQETGKLKISKSSFTKPGSAAAGGKA